MSGFQGDNSHIIAPHTGQPSFNVPMGYTQDKLPVGLQFMTRMFDDHKLIGYAYAYEQGTKHRKAPKAFPKLKKKKSDYRPTQSFH